MKEIALKGGGIAKVDDADFSFLNQFTWRLKKRKGKNSVYAVCEMPMHALLNPGFEMTDHRDNDGLNNQRENLRACSNSQNQANKPKPRHNTSGFKGVSFRPTRSNRFYAAIGFGGRRIHIGSFLTAEEAARAYDKKAIELFGPFAQLNFPATPRVLESSLLNARPPAEAPRLETQVAAPVNERPGF